MKSIILSFQNILLIFLCIQIANFNTVKRYNLSGTVA